MHASLIHTKYQNFSNVKVGDLLDVAHHTYQSLYKVTKVEHKTTEQGVDIIMLSYDQLMCIDTYNVSKGFNKGGSTGRFSELYEWITKPVESVEAWKSLYYKETV